MKERTNGSDPSPAPVNPPAEITPEMLAATARVAIAASVVQRIHRHARSEMNAEICGVLIGEEAAGVTLIEASIEGEGAAKGGAHVTFTQETWAHIYAVKDREFPEKRIVGWYHSHPGFGIFLSRQDLFIHENFFSASTQVAWVYDPHSDEEGCFGWVDGKVTRVREIRLIETAAADAPIEGEEPGEIVSVEEAPAQRRLGASEPDASPKSRRSSLTRKLFLLLALGVVFIAGVAGGVLLLPRTIVMYSLPDGRLLSPREVQSALDRARQRQLEEQRPPAEPPANPPAKTP
ncbi:MAG: Mov34/MPN/PAD-1 family protein [Bryobacterales bacterium]|nr:Mov34/MPN/PAD-1 family protein [Bryobacterales bacterium]